jgi:hypothetical protein
MDCPHGLLEREDAAADVSTCPICLMIRITKLTYQLIDQKAETKRLRTALGKLDHLIFTDPQVIERAGEMRDVIATALAHR